jgi:quinol monooxygenase YgiN
MAEKPVMLMARFKAKKDRVDEVHDLLMSLIEPTRSEEGCVFYYLHRDVNDPSRFIFYECFKDQSAFDAHAGKPYIKAFLGKTDELMAEPYEIVFLEKLA